jgi:hypothetical protein
MMLVVKVEPHIKISSQHIQTLACLVLMRWTAPIQRLRNDWSWLIPDLRRGGAMRALLPGNATSTFTSPLS